MSSSPIVDRIRIIPRPDDFLDRNVGSSGEVFFNKATNSLRVYSGKLAGGFEIARADLANVDTTSFLQQSNLGSLSIEEFQDVMYMPGPLPDDGQVLVWRTDHWMNEDMAGGASVDVAETAPVSPQSGNLWLDTSNGKLYIYINDGDSEQWIQPSTSLGGSSGSIPTTILDLGITDGTLGQVLATDGAGNFTFTTVSGGGGGGGVDLTALSVTQATASGNGTLTYNNLSGVFTYTPPDLSSYLTAEADTFATVTARGATTSDAVTINNTLTVNDLETGGAGTPTITSASTITLDAADATIVTGGPFRLPSFTTTQRNALTAVNGDMIYNTTDNKAQVYENGAWANLV